MKRMIQSSRVPDATNSQLVLSQVDSVPDIDNRPLSVEVVVAWLDRIVEVGNCEETISD